MAWIQCFGVFMAITSLKEPHRILDLISYQIFIMQSSVHCQKGCWVIHDRHFHNSRVSFINITVWKMAFPERPPAGSSYLPLNLCCTRASYCLLHFTELYMPGMNENPNPQCFYPSCNLDNICYRCVHTNTTDKKHKAIYCLYKQKCPRHPRSQEKHLKGLTQVVNYCGYSNLHISTY